MTADAYMRHSYTFMNNSLHNAHNFKNSASDSDAANEYLFPGSDDDFDIGNLDGEYDPLKREQGISLAGLWRVVS